MQVQPQGWEDPLEKGMTTHFSVLAWEIPWTGEPTQGLVHRVTKSRTRLKRQSMHTHTHTHTHTHLLADRIFSCPDVQGSPMPSVLRE